MQQRIAFNPLITLDLRGASDECLRIAAGQERAGIYAAANYWTELALDIEDGRYLGEARTAQLLEKAPFLKRFLR